MWRRSRTYPPMRYTVDFRQLERPLTRTSRLLEPKSIFAGFAGFAVNPTDPAFRPLISIQYLPSIG